MKAEIIPSGKVDEGKKLGFVLLGEHYDVHRFHPPLIYGRRGNAENGEGISLGVGKTKEGEKVYLLITYVLPIISARAVPQQINFYNDFSNLFFMQLASLRFLIDLLYLKYIPLLSILYHSSCTMKFRN